MEDFVRRFVAQQRAADAKAAGTQGRRDAGPTMQDRQDAGATTQDRQDAPATTKDRQDAPATTKDRQDAGATTAEVAFERRFDRRLHDAAHRLGRGESRPRPVELAGVKFLRMWNVWPNEPRLKASWLGRLAVLFTYTPLLIFAIIGAWRTAGRGWPYRLCWLPAVYLTLLHVVFVSSIRYREPAMLALLALAAGELSRWRQRSKEG